METPPITGVGIELISAEIFPTNPNMIADTAATTNNVYTECSRNR